MRMLVALLLAAGIAAGCGLEIDTSPALSGASSPAVTASPARPPDTVRPSGDRPALADGALGPGTFVLMPPSGAWGECVMGSDCGPEPPHATTLQLEITVPAGWKALEGTDGSVIAPVGQGSTSGPAGAGLVMGWSNRAGLHSDPCLTVAHRTPDIAVGPSVEDFVAAVLAHPGLDVSDPVDVDVGGYDGRFLMLTAPSDISSCDNWRPWEPGIFAQGPDNIWNLWIIDVDGLRMVLCSSEFPGTPAANSVALREMVESIRFTP